MIPKQFLGNMGILDYKDFLKLQNSKVVIVGLGGLGGNLANNLVRLGVKNLILVDFDIFDESNLNRQLFSNITTIGKSKVDILKNVLEEINPLCSILVLSKHIEDIPIDHFIDCDYLIDAVDNPQTKIYLSKLSTELDIPLLHGSCGGWYGQVGWILPGNLLLEELYTKGLKGLEEEILNPSFTPSAVAAVMTSEFVKMIKDLEETTTNELLLIDIFNNTLLKTGQSK